MLLSNTTYDLTTLTALITIFGILVKSICTNNKTILTKIVMGLLAIGLDALTIRQYYITEMLNSIGGVNIFFTYDVELVE